MSRFRPIYDNANKLIDLEVERPGASPLVMLGPGGPDREKAVVSALRRWLEANPGRQVLPVLLGAGLGHALHALREEMELHGLPGLALVDKESDLLEAAFPAGESNLAGLLHLSDPDPQKVLSALSQWQDQNGGLPFLPLPNPFYQRLDKAYYGFLREQLAASQNFDFWTKARQPRFRGSEPRLLLITSRYFLVGEVAEACARLGVNHRLLTLENDEMASRDFVESLLRHVLDFKPDAVLTLNHLGVDREGLLTDLLARLELPLASWFVDNPHLVLHLYEGLSSPWLAIFTWDADNISSLKAQGFEHVFHLPLGTDPKRFSPQPGAAPDSWKAELSFVGNSMVHKVAKRMEKARLPQSMLANYRQVAADFTASSQRSMLEFIQAYSPELSRNYDSLPDREAQLAYETMLTWESTRQYRTACVQRLFDVDPALQPLIVGDDGWHESLRDEKRPWRWHPPMAYYNELPRFYPLSAINFNTTSMQMKGAVNQRVFDVPAAGAFVLTDWREQMDELFEPGKEIAYYRQPDEIPDLARFYLSHPQERRRISEAGRKRVLACHTWDKRLEALLRMMKETFGS